jgi:uncharacterized protein YbbC (DUF1343 family)
MRWRHETTPLGLALLLWTCAAGAPRPVRPGIDVLLADSLHLVRGRRVGLLTNQSGVDAHGVDDVTRLRAAGVALTALFSPEHGFRGWLDQENIGHGVDSATGLPLYSLYGDVRAPTGEMLADVDVLLVDLQDVGARTYTYVSTMLLAMEAAGAHDVDVIVLDRPNPIGGVLVQGPVLDPALASFVGMLPIPLRHGMTIGELARFGNDALGYGASLTVAPVAGWRRPQWLDETALPWVRPSPSMPELESAAHYPGLVLLEATNVSVGRGTPLAFQAVGAPWLDAPALARVLAAEPGVAVGDTVVTPRAPSDGKYADRPIPAVRLRVVDRARYDPVRLALVVLATLATAHRDSLAVNQRRLDERTGSAQLREALEAGQEPAHIASAWEAGIADFKARRQRYLLYPDELP